MGTTVEETTEKVRGWLAEMLGSYEVSRTGSTTFRKGSARVFVDVYSYGEDGTVVRLQSWVLFDVPRTPELFEWLAFHTQPWVSFFADANEDESLVDIGCATDLLGTHLDEAELRTAAISLMFAADEKDDELQAKFGGERFHED